MPSIGAAYRKETIMREIVQSAHPGTDEHLLLREMSHRMSNELAAAIAMISRSARRSANDDAKTVLEEVAERLHSYAQVHRSLESPSHDELIDASTYLRALCQSISRSKLDFRDIDLRFRESSLKMHANTCWRVGMIVSELIANSARHAFDENGGEIQVALLPHGMFVKCIVADNGKAPEAVRPGRGLTIVENLAASLDGRIDHHFTSHGTVSILAFPKFPSVHKKFLPSRLGAGNQYIAGRWSGREH
jgi:two-component sensor histidine kinase